MKRLSLRSPLVASFIVFIALCMSLAYWGLQVMKPRARAVAVPPPSVAQEVPVEAAATLFGGQNVAAAASNYQLKGIVADGRGQRSVAILSVDGKPSQAVGIGALVAPGVTVQEVFATYVLLREGGAQKRLDLPEPPRANGAVNATPIPLSPPAPPVVTAPPQQGFVLPTPMSQPVGSTPPPRPTTTTVTPTPPNN